MAPSQLTIQSFYGPCTTKSTSGQLNFATSTTKPCDGFTSAELTTALDPLQVKFNPTREYSELVVAALSPGPNARMFTGRIVNFTTHHVKSKSQNAAKGWHHLIVKDDTGAVCVKLYFTQKPYVLRLGLMVSIWTTFVSRAKSMGVNADGHMQTGHGGGIVIPDAPLSVNIFPGRDAGSHIVMHSVMAGGCRTPLHHTPGVELEGLMTLKSFVEGGNETEDARVLICVKSIGAKKKITTKTGTELELVEVVLLDDTAETVLKLWDGMVSSAREWKAGSTILLLTRPGFRFEYNGKTSLGILPKTMVDVDPEFPDAVWLREWAGNAHRAETMRQDWKEGVFDVEAAMNGIHRILFTIADVDEWARAHPSQTFTGFLSLTILDMNLALLSRRNMLLVSECCGVPIYGPSAVSALPQDYSVEQKNLFHITNSDTTTNQNPTTVFETAAGISQSPQTSLQTTCPHCSTNVPLSLNPKVLGTLLDETGSITGAKLLWRPQAWEELFGSSVEELVEMGREVGGRLLRLLEQRMLGMRVHLGFGWEGMNVAVKRGGGGVSSRTIGGGGVGRLCILGVRM